MLRDSLIAAIRTGVASLVGFIVAFLVAQGFELDESFQINLTTALTVGFTALYNWLVILLEKNVNPKFGLLLGVPRTPVYDNKPVV